MIVILLTLAAHAGGPVLDVVGACPGPAAVTIDGIVPGSTVAILAGSGPGSDIIPGGPCTGSTSGLAGLMYIASIVDSDGDGQIRIEPILPPASCGRSLQALELSACALSGLEVLGDVPGATHLWEEDFINGVVPVDECASWESWRATLPASGLVAMRMSGSFDEIVEAGLGECDGSMCSRVADDP